MKLQKKKPEWEVNEPRFNALNYDESILNHLSYYNLEVDSKLKQQWVIEYYNEQGLDIKGLDKLLPMYFDQAGVLVRLIRRGIELIPTHKSYLKTKYQTLRDLTPKQEKNEKVVSDLVEKIDEIVKDWNKANQALNLIDDEVDYIISGGEVKSIKFKLLINELKLKNDDYQYIKHYINHEIQNYTDILNDIDDYLKEAYAHIPKKLIKKIIKYLEEIHGMCGLSRILRESKPKSPTILVKALQYLKEALGIKSIAPEKIIGASELWVFDTNKRKLAKYKADEGSKLTVKGTTVLNWSYELSSQKIVRKPEDIIKQFTLGNKSELKKIFDSINAVDSEVKGRMNEDILLLRVF